MRVAVLGATGYTGQLLVRLVASHPAVREVLAVSSSQAGRRFSEVDPGWCGPGEILADGGTMATIEEAAGRKPDVVFAALPHLESARLCEPFFGGSVVIDLSADFRFRSPEAFQRAYGAAPYRADLLPGAVYGLVEWYRRRLSGADVIANPGCYPTAALLPLLPLVSAGVVGGTIVVNAISGISGAGRKAKAEYLFCERSENAGAYAPGRSHRHMHEIEAELQAVSREARVLFTPHLAPLRRGLAATTVAPLARGLTAAEVGKRLAGAYGDSPFVVLTGERIPQTADVRGSNRCDIGWRVEGDTLMLFSAIDNLVKGASGQAVQNMNVRFGLPETQGLSLAAEV